MAADAIGLTIEPLAPEELSFGRTVVVDVGVATRLVVVVVGDVTVTLVVVESHGEFVVGGGAPGSAEAVRFGMGVDGDVESVRARTNKSTGLDHITICLPLDELRAGLIRIEG